MDTATDRKKTIADIAEKIRKSGQPKHPIDCMEAALNTFRERNKTYGDNYLQHGEVMTALFPDGIKLNSVEDWNRFGVINMIVAKLTRYAQGWPKVHQDSVHDLGVYAFMLESLDSGVKK